MVNPEPTKTTLIFDYNYESPVQTSNYSRPKITLTLIVVKLAKKLPEFEICKEGFVQKILNAVGMPDINFPEDKEFSKKFVLKGKDETSVKEAFNDNVRAFFVNDKIGFPFNFSIQCNGDSILFMRRPKVLSPDELKQELTYLEEFLGAFRN